VPVVGRGDDNRIQILEPQHLPVVLKELVVRDAVVSAQFPLGPILQALFVDVGQCDDMGVAGHSSKPVGAASAADIADVDAVVGPEGSCGHEVRRGNGSGGRGKKVSAGGFASCGHAWPPRHHAFWGLVCAGPVRRLPRTLVFEGLF